MLRRMLVPLLIGIGGCAILIWLGLWQVHRLQWKESVLADIEARIGGAPESLPAAPDPEADRYRPVRVAGRFTGDALDVLVAPTGGGAAYRVIAALETDAGRRIMVDRGVVPDAERGAGHGSGAAVVTGNLHWPDESDRFTPDPDLEDGLWFARDVPAMARALRTGPVLVVARTVEGADEGVEPVPVGTEGIPNDHLQYAITWFSLALVWAGMTVLLLWRIRQRGRQEG